MNLVIISAAVVAAVGIVVGIGLGLFGEKFKVEVDEKEAAVREALPGNNCGACGFAGCDAMAKAIAQGKAPVNGCPVGGEGCAKAIGDIMGVAAERYSITIRESRTAVWQVPFRVPATRPAPTDVWVMVPAYLPAISMPSTW